MRSNTDRKGHPIMTSLFLYGGIIFFLPFVLLSSNNLKMTTLWHEKYSLPKSLILANYDLDNLITISWKMITKSIFVKKPFLFSQTKKENSNIWDCNPNFCSCFSCLSCFSLSLSRMAFWHFSHLRRKRIETKKFLISGILSIR